MSLIFYIMGIFAILYIFDLLGWITLGIDNFSVRLKPPTADELDLLKKIKECQDESHTGVVSREQLSKKTDCNVYSAFDAMDALKRKRLLDRYGWNFKLSSYGISCVLESK